MVGRLLMAMLDKISITGVSDKVEHISVSVIIMCEWMFVVVTGR